VFYSLKKNALEFDCNNLSLENWEQGRAKPNAQAATLIMMVRQFSDMLDKLSLLTNHNA